MPQHYDPQGHAIVARDFRFAGVEYKAGEEFPVEKLGLIDFELRGLWAADLIRFERQKVVYVDQSVTGGDREKAAKPSTFREKPAKVNAQPSTKREE